MKKNTNLSLLITSFSLLSSAAFNAHSAEVLHILSSGQSLSIGDKSIPAISTTSMHNTVMLDSHIIHGVNLPLVPLVEKNIQTTGETPSSGLANSLYMYDAAKRKIAISLHGRGAAPYDRLKLNTAYFNLGIEQARRIRSAIIAQGNTYKPIAVTITHGESDYQKGKSAYYAGYLAQWQRDYQNQMRIVTGNSALYLPMFITQMNTARSGDLANQQLLAAKANLDKIILVAPKYQYKYIDTLHLTNINSKHMGEMYAKVIKHVVFDKKRWLPVMPLTATRTNNVIKISYNVPVGNLVLDTKTVAQRPNYGFSFAQSSGNTVGITKVSISGKDIYITLSSIPTGTNKQIRYAWAPSTACTWCGGAGNGGLVGGNIRDQDISISPAKNSTRLPLHNWSVAFSQTVN